MMIYQKFHNALKSACCSCSV